MESQQFLDEVALALEISSLEHGDQHWLRLMKRADDVISESIAALLADPDDEGAFSRMLMASSMHASAEKCLKTDWRISSGDG